jgi:hypothetical protein
MIAVFLSMFLGAGPIRRTGEELASGSSNPWSEPAASRRSEIASAH